MQKLIKEMGGKIKLKKCFFLSVLALPFIFIVYFYHDVDPKPDKDCLTKPHSYEKTNCLIPYFEALTVKQSPEFAIKRAEEFKKDGLINDCHLIAHYIGEANLFKHELDVAKAFSTCSFGCIEGCFHGVMEASVSHTNMNETEMVSLCDSMLSNSGLHRQCIHGIGHGLLAHSYTPLLEAIKICQNFNTAFKTNTCLGGLFMENIDQYFFLDSDSMKEQMPFICDQVLETNDPELTKRCFSDIGGGLMFYTGHDLHKSIEFCEILKKPNNEICIDGAKFEQQTNLRH